MKTMTAMTMSLRHMLCAVVVEKAASRYIMPPSYDTGFYRNKVPYKPENDERRASGQLGDVKFLVGRHAKRPIAGGLISQVLFYGAVQKNDRNFGGESLG
jgi:hypothetical protein